MSELSRQAQSLLTAFHQADGIGEGPTDEQRSALRRDLRHLVGASAFTATMTVAAKAAATHGLTAAPAPIGVASTAMAGSATTAAGGSTVAATVGTATTSAVMTSAAVGTHNLVGLLVALLIGASAGGVVVGTSALAAREPSSPASAVATPAARDTEHSVSAQAPTVNRPGQPIAQATPSPTAAPPSVSPPGASQPTTSPPTTERDLPPALRAAPGNALHAPANQPVDVGPIATAQADSSRATLGEEASLLRTAQEHIKAGRATSALEVLDEHRRRFPQGALGIEGRAARVVALCQLGRMAEGRREWSDFARDYPDSPLLSRLATACKTP